MLTVKDPSTFDWKNIPLDVCILGNAMDTINTLRVYEMILELLRKENLEHFFETVLSPALELFAESEYEGVDIDVEMLSKLDSKLRLELLDLEDTIVEIAGNKNFNVNSDQQLARLMYEDENGFGLVPIKFTPKGNISVDAEVIKITKLIVTNELASRK